MVTFKPFTILHLEKLEGRNLPHAKQKRHLKKPRDLLMFRREESTPVKKYKEQEEKRREEKRI
jgi:hypothetical protein